MTLSRRSIFSALAALPFVGGFVRSSFASQEANEWQPMTWIYAENFAELKEKLDALPNQCLGSPTAVCEATGELYVEINNRAIARPNDVAVIEQAIAKKTAFDISQALSNRTGTIYWRIPLEIDISPCSVVSMYADDGPDIDFITNRRCYTDKDWVKVHAYVRLTRAKT